MLISGGYQGTGKPQTALADTAAGSHDRGNNSHSRQWRRGIPSSFCNSSYRCHQQTDPHWQKSPTLEGDGGLRGEIFGKCRSDVSHQQEALSTAADISGFDVDSATLIVAESMLHHL